LARLVVAAVKEQGRTKSDVARDYRVSRRWVQTLCKRHEVEGDAGLEPRSRRPGPSPHQTPVELEEEIVELRKALADQGLDAGAHTIRNVRISAEVSPGVSTSRSMGWAAAQSQGPSSRTSLDQLPLPTWAAQRPISQEPSALARARGLVAQID
jgi:transposase